MIRVAIVLATLAACSNLEDIDAGVCGNGVLEAGEDCDSRDPRCVQCGIRCDHDALSDDDDASCATFGGTEGFVCGADDFCHAPLGRFRAPTVLSTSTETVRASDVDGDGHGDLIVQSATAIRVLYGNADGHPTTSQQVLTPIARGAAFYANIDADPTRTLDVLLPAADGIVAYTSPYGVLSPYPFPSIVSSASEGVAYYSHGLEDTVIGFAGTPPGSTAVFYLVRDVGPMAGPPVVAMAPVCGATSANFKAANVDVFRVNANYHLFATTFDEGAITRLCVLAIQKTTTYSVTEVTVNLGIGRTAGSRPVFAPIGTGPCPSLVVRERVGMQPPGDVVAYAATGTTSCSYSNTPITRVLSTDKGDPIGWAPLVPADSTGATVAMAMQAGVWAVPAAGPLTKLLYLSDRPLHAIRAADLDGDGDVDLVANSAIAGALVEDIDLLSRIPMGFVRYRLDTQGPVDQMTIGDYDGSGISDVAYVQTRVIGGVGRYELAIAYGTRDQLLPGTSVGTYGRIISLLETNIPDSNDPFNIVSDLVVLFEDDAANEMAITLLHGSPQRTMLGFFDPREDQLPTTFRGVVAGNFNDAPGTTGLDLIAIEDGAGAPRVWRSNGPTGGEVEQMLPHAVPLLADCAKPGTGTSICIDGARYVAWPVDPTRDRVIAFGADRSGAPRIITFDPHAGTTALPATAWPALPELAAARVRTAEVVRAGDGTAMLVLSTLVGLEPHVLLCAMEAATGLPTACHDLGARIAQPGQALACTHATTARVRPIHRFMEAPRTAADLVVLCHERANPDASTALYQLPFETAEVGPAVELLRPGRAREVQTGDLDGNGIVDLLTIDRESAVPTIRIHRQCTSREEKTCGV